MQLYDLVVYLETEGTEFHANGDLMLSLEIIIHNSLHKAGLADTSIPNDNEFKELVLGVKGFVCYYLVRDAGDIFKLAILHVII